MPARKFRGEGNEVKLPYPLPAQQKILSQIEGKKMVTIVNGRRHGKTFLCLILVIERCIKNPGYRVVWGNPTAKQCKLVMVEFEKALGKVCNINHTDMKITFPNDSSCTFLSLDSPENARGFGCELLILDEASFLDEKSWKAVTPMLLGAQNSQLIAISTPNGTGNKFHNLFIECNEREDCMAFTAPTVGCRIQYNEKIGQNELIRVPHELENPTIPWSDILSLFNEMSERTFRQEVLAEFLSDESPVFRGINHCVDEKVWCESPVRGHSYVFGVDVGKLHDFTVITVLDETKKQVVFIDRFNKIEYEVQYSRIKSLASIFKPTTIVVEANSIGEPMIEHLRNSGWYITPITQTNVVKKRIIEKLAVCIEKREITLPKFDQLLKELREFEMTKLPGGSIRYSAPIGQDKFDDCVISLALAIDQGSWPVSSSDINIW